MKSFVRWMRQVLPRDTLVATAVGCDVLVELVYLWIAWRFGGVDESFFAKVRLIVQVVAATSYGVYRVGTFHPACDSDYRQWLRTTPWTPRSPLPMGPVHVVPQDIVLICASMLLCRVEDWRVLYIPTAFFCAYCATLATFTWATGQKVLAYALGAGLGGVVFGIQYPVAAFGAAVTTALLAPVAIRASLRSFPWELPGYLAAKSFQQHIEDQQQQRIGWPFDVFTPQPPKAWVSWTDGLGVSLLAGWWYLAFYWQAEFGAKPFLWLIVAFTSGIGGLVRLGVYATNHRPPISFWGRFATLRPWQRGYDEIVLSPALATIVGVCGLTLTVMAENPGARLAMQLPTWLPLLTAPGGLALSIGILLLGGPGLERWRLSGRHRLVFEHATQTSGLGHTAKNQNFVQIG
jgi:hypothetical protein